MKELANINDQGRYYRIKEIRQQEINHAEELDNKGSVSYTKENGLQEFGMKAKALGGKPRVSLEEEGLIFSQLPFETGS